MSKLIFGNHQENTLTQVDMVIDSGAEHFVLCADGHLGYGHPIGGVAAYKNKISLSGVGKDISCGNLASRTTMKGKDLAENIGAIMDEIVAKISCGVGRNNKGRVDSPVFDNPLFATNDILRSLLPMTRDQFGTIGAGNHYVDLFVDDSDDSVWIGIHFGSRGLGYKFASHYFDMVNYKDGYLVKPALLDADSNAGQEYLAGMELCGDYAYESRYWVGHKVAEILGANITKSVHNHHNYCWIEEHFGETYYVVRKGATPAFPGQLGFIGGSMGDNAVIVEGVESELSKSTLYSTIHGAGRDFSRAEAKGRYVKDENGKKQRGVGRVRHDEMQKWLNDKGVVVRGGDLDEAPQAYRRLDDVLKFHEGTIKILHTLRPVGVMMAGPNTFDPYKD